MRGTGSTPPPPPEAEVRHATVVKCDIVGSTRLKTRLNLDGQLAFKREWERAVRDVATSHAGHVERFEGDAALVLFGHPEAQEDAAESAVRMGLAVIEAVGRVQAIPNVQLQLRVGVASGLVAVIRRPWDEKSETVEGLTIDLAERLKTLADPGTVVVADATKRLARGFFEYDDLGAVAAKGFEDESVRAWRVARASQIASRFQAQRFDPSSHALVGREETLDMLRRAWRQARDGAGNAVCLVADAGLGKSRLAREALDLAARDDALVLEIDCTPSTRNSPLFPLGVLLRRIAKIPQGPEDDKTTRAREFLASFMPPDAVADALTHLGPLFGLSLLKPADRTPEQVRERTIAQIVNILYALAARGPLALLCEDLHWADDTTASVVKRVAAEIPGLRVLLIATTRPQAQGEEPFDWANFTTVELEALPSSTAADLVRSIDSSGALADDVVAAIVDRCEGVPLVLEEVARNAIDRGTSAREIAAAPAREGLNPLELVVQARLARWPELTPVVQAAAVLGRDFALDVLEHMVPAEHHALLPETVDRLAADGLLSARRSAAADRARFKHVMIWDAVYNTLLESDRQRLHSHAADTLIASFHGTPDASAEVLAEHLLKAARFPEAIRTRLEASVDTASRGAYVETRGHCEAALQLVDRIADANERRYLQFRLLVQLGVALTGQHGYAAVNVEEAYRKAQEVCGEQGEAEMLYPIMRALATVNLVRGNLGPAHDLSAQALHLAKQSGRPAFVIDAMSVRCYTTLYFGTLQECRSCIDECVALYRRHDGHTLEYPVPQDAATAALALMPTVAWLMGDSAAAEKAVAEGLEHVTRLGREFDKALMHAWIAGTRYTQRRYREAAQHAGIALTISQEHQYEEWLGTGLLMALLAQAAMAPSQEALSQAQDTCAAFAAKGVGLNASYYLWGLARGHVIAGSAPTACYLVDEAFRRAEESGETRMNAELWVLKAELEADDAAAARLLQNALELSLQHGAIATALRAASLLAIRTGSAQAEEARAALAMLDGAAQYPPEPGWMAQRLARLSPQRSAGASGDATLLSFLTVPLESVVDGKRH